MLITFMFLVGATGSVALCNVAGTISDLFGDEAVAGQAMGRELSIFRGSCWGILSGCCYSVVLVVSDLTGPSLGSPVGQWIAENPKMGFSWIGWINVIISGIYATGMLFLPEYISVPRYSYFSIG